MLAHIKQSQLAAIVSLLALTVSGSSNSVTFATNFPERAIVVESTSGQAEIALAQHLQIQKVKLYGAYWCSHCYEQIYLFGQEAFSLIDRIECDPLGKNAQPEQCKAAKLQGYPTWEIDGKFYCGMRPLQELADLSGYTGAINFKNSTPVNIPSQYSPRRPNTVLLEKLLKIN